ncbi:ScbA/BarX family gamma-butyrolactone biosynthesis protein [Streptomyces griseoloalbus]|uniref:ScbA/BarX family gamma-butyrolactone biosynthesis protein n=1 Tax=Streptomyces griseoloalbus TaxID=67303 RepID=A0ABV3E2X0_9ACTN
MSDTVARPHIAGRHHTDAPPDTDDHQRERVPKELVHLRDPQRVLITDWRRSGADTFLLRAQWPAHTGSWPYDPRLLTQTIRQSGLTVAHAEYQVPLTHQTTLREFHYTVNPDFRVHPGEAPLFEVEVSVPRHGQTGRTARALPMDMRVFREGALVAGAQSDFSWVSPPAYRRLRGERVTVDWGNWPLPAPLDPASVGRAAASDVVLSPTGEPLRWLLRSDIANTHLLDHPVDHVPGLGLIEAAVQAAQATVQPGVFHPTAVDTEFERYVEFDVACLVEAEPLHKGPDTLVVRITGTQSGHTAFRSELTGTIL